MSKRIIIIVLISLVLIVLIFVVVSQSRNNQHQGQPQIQNNTVAENSLLTLQEVLDSPSKYDGKKIAIDCFYYEATEKVVLATEVIEHEGGWRSVQNDDVWVAWTITPTEKFYSMLNKLPGRGEPDFYGRVKVEGIFRKAREAGHLGEYKYTFGISKVSVYDKNKGEFSPVE